MAETPTSPPAKPPFGNNPFGRIMALPNEDPRKTLFVAFLVAFICAVAVSVVTVALRPIQIANLDRERQAQMADMIARLPGMEDILKEAGADSLETRIVDLATGTYADDIDAATFDQRAAANDPEMSIKLTAEQDIAAIKRRSNYAPVYLLKSGDELILLILPVHGAGFTSTLYGYLAIQGDLNTIAALTFYEQGDTPGLGARITEPEWQALWAGKQIADESGNVLIEVVGDAEGPYQVDAISGATYTSDGVQNLVRFWLGPDGFGPYLDKLKQGEL